MKKDNRGDQFREDRFGENHRFREIKVRRFREIEVANGWIWDAPSIEASGASFGVAAENGGAGLRW